MGADSSKLSPRDVEDLQKNTKFTAFEIAEHYTKFKKDFPEGKITKPEFRELYRSLFPKGKPEAFADQLFETYDQDKNGYIDFTEFMCTLSCTNKGTPDEKLQWAFDLYDMDRNGYICQKEVRSIIRAVFQMKRKGKAPTEKESSPEEVTANVFKKLDRDQDGRLSDKEFIIGLKFDSSIMARLM